MIVIIKYRLSNDRKGVYKLELKPRTVSIYKLYNIEYFFLVLPIIIIGTIIYMRLPHLYNLSDNYTINTTIIMGFQWYWILNNNEVFYEKHGIRHIISSNEVIGTNVLSKIGFTGSSNDVIHRMYIPSIYFKIDLIPGRIRNSTILEGNLVNYGVCAEICGANHAFIPFKYNIVAI